MPKYRLTFIEGNIERRPEAPHRPLAESHTEEFDDENAALHRAREILAGNQYHTVSFSHGTETLSEPRLRDRLRIRNSLDEPISLGRGIRTTLGQLAAENRITLRRSGSYRAAGAT